MTTRALVHSGLDMAALIEAPEGLTATSPDAASGHQGGLETGRAVARTVLALAYLAAGILHVSIPAPFVLITPDWVPFPHQVIFLTGLCEIAGAIALISGLFRRTAGVALALYAVCVFPANLKHAFVGMPAGSVQLGWWYHAPRLALQPIIVWWALFAGGLVTWPFGGTPEATKETL